MQPTLDMDTLDMGVCRAETCRVETTDFGSSNRVLSALKFFLLTVPAFCQKNCLKVFHTNFSEKKVKIKGFGRRVKTE